MYSSTIIQQRLGIMHTSREFSARSGDDLLYFAHNYCTLAQRSSCVFVYKVSGAAQSDKVYVPSPPRNVHLHDPSFSVAMAVAPDVNNQNLEELEREITCAVCHKHYQEAKLLPCNHYYCGACIETLAKRSLGRPFLCPECRKATNLPPGGVEQLQSAFFVERMKDVYGKMAKVAGKVEATCECYS